MKKVLSTAIIIIVLVSLILRGIETILEHKDLAVKANLATKTSNITNNTKKSVIAQPSTSKIVDKTPIIRKDNNLTKQKLVDYLWEKTKNIDMILTFERESGLDITRVNGNKDKQGKVWSWDYGICQLNSVYHWDFITSKDFKNPYKQLDYCIAVYNKAIKSGRIKTTFYAYNKKETVRERFIITQEAYDIFLAIK